MLYISNFIKNNTYDIIVMIINLFIFYNFDDVNLLLILISLDSLFYAIDFIYLFIRNTEKKLIIESNNNLYNYGLVERYTFYFILYMLYFCVIFFVFGYEVYILKYFIGILSIPKVFKFMTINYSFVGNILSKINYEKNKLLIKLCVYQTVHIIDNISVKYLNKNINKSNVEKIILEINGIDTYIIKFLKNTIYVFIMIFLRNNSKITNITYTIIKHIYGYNYGDYIKSINIDEAKDLLINIIDNDDYHKIIKPLTIQSMIFLYKNGNSNNNYIEQFYFKFLTIMTLWTLSSFVSKYILLVISLIFRWNNMSLKNKIIMIIISYFIDNQLLICIISQLNHTLIINSATINSSKIICKKIINNVWNIMLIVNTNVNLYYKYYFIVILSLLLKDSKYFTYVNMVVPLVLTYDNNIYLKYLYIILYIAIINSQNFYKLFLLTYILSAINIFLLYTYNKNSNIIILNDKMSVVDDYIIIPNSNILFQTNNKTYIMITKNDGDIIDELDIDDDNIDIDTNTNTNNDKIDDKIVNKMIVNKIDDKIVNKMIVNKIDDKIDDKMIDNKMIINKIDNKMIVNSIIMTDNEYYDNNLLVVRNITKIEQMSIIDEFY
jgi:hypothetical protein